MTDAEQKRAAYKDVFWATKQAVAIQEITKLEATKYLLQQLNYHRDVEREEELYAKVHSDSKEDR